MGNCDKASWNRTSAQDYNLQKKISFYSNVIVRAYVSSVVDMVTVECSVIGFWDNLDLLRL